MIIPGKHRVGFILTLLSVAALLVVGGAWALFTGYGYVLFDAATGAVSDIRHLNDLLVLQNAAWLLGFMVAVMLSTALTLLYIAERRRTRNLVEIAAVLKAHAAGDWYRTPHIHKGESEESLALAMVELAESIRAKGVGIVNTVKDEKCGADIPDAECGVLSSKSETISVDDFIRRSGDHFKQLAKPKKLIFRISIAKNLPPIHVDRLKLRYVFEEFLRNSISCASEGGTVALRATLNGNFLRFEVQDDGPGIHPDLQDQVFKKTYRPSKYGHVRPNAPHSGLFVAKSLIEKLGGEAGLSSVEGRGSIFHFTLPVAEIVKPKKDVSTPKRRINPKPAVLGGSRRRSS